MLDAVLEALQTTGRMAWQIAWSLILGFMLASIVQALVHRDAIVEALGDDRPKTLLTATGLGAAASSCSYAAVALARSLFRKGASFPAAMVFEIASTNLVIELGIIMALLLGWQFTLAEYFGGIVMIVAVAVAFRLFVHQDLVDAARKQAEKGLAGSMEGHAAMDMSIASNGGVIRRLLSGDGRTAVSHIFVMEWAAVLRDILIGLFVAGAVAAWVPDSWWQALFLSGDGVWATLWGPIIGPVIAVLSFVCSIGNVPLAAVLWNGGISFGGVVAFIFGDLIIIPILLIYRRYYGARATLRITAIFYVTMVLGGYVVETVFWLVGLIPESGNAYTGSDGGISWNYTTWLNIVFGLLAAALLIRFFATGGRQMLRHMNGPPDDSSRHEGHDHRHG